MRNKDRTFKEWIHPPYRQGSEASELTKWDLEKEYRKSTQGQHKDVRNEEGAWNRRTGDVIRVN